jgi:hypothetical protein
MMKKKKTSRTSINDPHSPVCSTLPAVPRARRQRAHFARGRALLAIRWSKVRIPRGYKPLVRPECLNCVCTTSTKSRPHCFVAGKLRNYYDASLSSRPCNRMPVATGKLKNYPRRPPCECARAGDRPVVPVPISRDLRGPARSNHFRPTVPVQGHHTT